MLVPSTDLFTKENWRMMHEKIFRRDGLRIKVGVSLFIDNYRDEVKWNSCVEVAEPRKKNFRLPREGDGEFSKEIYETQIEFYQIFHPNLKDINKQ